MQDAGSEVRPERLDRRTAWLQLTVATVVLVGLAWRLVPWDWVPGRTLHPVSPEAVLSRREIARAEDYSGYVRPLSQLSYVASLLVVLVLGLSRWGAHLAGRLPGPRWVQVPLTALVLTTLQVVVTIPFGLFVRARNLQEGLTRQALGPWFVDRLLSLLVTWVLTAVLLLLVVAAARRWPRRWYVVAGAGAAVVVFTASLLYPLLVEPLFNRFTPLADGPLRSSLLRLADETGVHVDDVLVADASRRTTTINAYVSGFGGTRRIVLYDTLLHDLDPAEVRAVVAHELGHARNQDVLLGTGLGALAVLAGVSALALLLDAAPLRRRAGVEEPAGAAGARVVPLVLALAAVGTFLASPVENVVSRAIEARADRVSLEVTRDRSAFDRLQAALAVRSLADPTPPTYSYLWFATHPTLVQRLGIARALLPGRTHGGTDAGGGG